MKVGRLKSSRNERIKRLNTREILFKGGDWTSRFGVRFEVEEFENEQIRSQLR